MTYNIHSHIPTAAGGRNTHNTKSSLTVERKTGHRPAHLSTYHSTGRKLNVLGRWGSETLTGTTVL